MRSLIGFVLLLVGLVACSDVEKHTFIDEAGYRIACERLKEDTTLLHGVYKRFLGDTLLEESHYLNGQKNGITTYYTFEGQVEEQLTYQNDQLNGMFKAYYPDGTLKQQMTYLNDELQDTMISYYSNGHKKELVVFEGGEEKGLFKEYYNNGILAVEGVYDGEEIEVDTLKKYDSLGMHIQTMFCSKVVVGEVVFSKCESLWKQDTL